MVLTSRKNAAGPKGQAFEVSHEEAQVSSGTQKAGWMHAWQSPYEIIGDGLVCVGFLVVCCFVRSA